MTSIPAKSVAGGVDRYVLIRTRVRPAWICVALASCVPSRAAVFDPVGRDVRRRIGLDVSWSDDSRTSAAIDQLVAKPLALDGALRIALARNAHLQARFEELGIAASEIASATVLRPAEVDIDHKFGLRGSGSETEIEIVQDVLDLIQIGQRRAVAEAELAAVQARATDATVELVADVEVAFDDLIAAQQQRELVQTAFEAASASADLVERQHAAGNTTDLALAREQEQRERLRIEVARAEQDVRERHARLGALLGIGARAFTAEGRLPDPPADPPKLDDLERSAEVASLDAAALHAEADAAAARHRVATVRAFLPELGIGASAARREGLDWAAGPTIRVGLPLFDQQQGPRARSRAEERRARAELAATATDLAAVVEATRTRALQAYAEARQLHDTVLPLRQRVLDQTVLQYNAMNASTFELLVARRDMVDVGRQYIEALRRYWTAMAEVKALERGAHAKLMTEESR